MKNKLFFAFALMALCCPQVFATCQAGFTWQQTSNNVIVFTNTSTSSAPYVIYQWTFGDNSNSFSQSPVHTYSNSGLYVVCLALQDSNNCTSTFCDTITVTGLNCNNLAVTVSTTSATCSTCNDGTATATGFAGTPPYSYLWNTTQTTQTISNIIPGTYTCCITDAVGCTACYTTSVNFSSCQASFTWSQTSNNVISFTNTSTGIPFQCTYFWNFGDNTYDWVQNPVHMYVVPGLYVVSLTDTCNNCNSIFYDTLTVTGINCNNLAVSIAGVDASCPSCTDGSASAAASGGTPPYTYQWSNNSTATNISNLPPGYYTCCITDGIGCTACNGVMIDSSGGCSAYFTLTPAGPPHTYTMVNFASGNPPISYYWSWGDNTFDTIPLPTHTYSVPGYYTICLSITDAWGCQSMYCDTNFLARLQTDNAMITVTVVSASTGINIASSENSLSVFPNPASNNLIVDYSLSSSANVDVTLSDVLGNTLLSFNKDVAEGKNEITMDISSVRQGVYFLSLRTNDFVVARKITVIK